MIVSNAAPQAGVEGGPERLTFMPTPRNIETAFEKIQELPDQKEFKEHIADMDAERIATLLQSVEGQEELCNIFINQHDTFQEADVHFDPEEIKSHVQLVGATLKDMREYDELIRQAEGIDPQADITVDTPETQKKPGLFRRALGSVGRFAKKHPVVTALTVTAVAAAAIAGGFYMSGGIEQFLQRVGVSHIIGGEGAAEGAREFGNVIMDPETWSHGVDM